LNWTASDGGTKGSGCGFGATFALADVFAFELALLVLVLAVEFVFSFAGSLLFIGGRRFVSNKGLRRGSKKKYPATNAPLPSRKSTTSMPRIRGTFDFFLGGPDCRTSGGGACCNGGGEPG